MIDMSMTMIKREDSLSPASTIKTESLPLLPPQKKSHYFSIDQILGRREAEVSGGPSVPDEEVVFDKDAGGGEGSSDAESLDDPDKMMVDYQGHLDDEELTDSEETIIVTNNNNHKVNNNNNTNPKNNEIQNKDEAKDSKNDKTTPSYTAIIAQAILSSSDKKLPLGCIYDYIAEHFPEFLKKGQGWRNCVRHNLSLSECFIKAGRARNGRGNYWGIHPRYIKNFTKGDFRKRRASHRPRNRDLNLMGYGLSRYYPYYYNPFAAAASQGYGSDKTSTLVSPNTRRGFSVDNILSKGQRVDPNGSPPNISLHKPTTWNLRDSYRTATTKTTDGDRKTRLCSPPNLTAIVPTSLTYLEHYNYPPHHTHARPGTHHSHHRSSYEYGRPSTRTTECSCRSYECTSRTLSKHWVKTKQKKTHITYSEKIY